MTDIHAEFDSFVDRFLKSTGDIDEGRGPLSDFHGRLDAYRTEVRQDMHTPMLCVPTGRKKLVDLAPLIKKCAVRASHAHG